ncbi:hypothetical protein BASA81_006629 [Batrachochytrium salamandrivorans]|nr:hypothetical protein BASA81_006629 [Batrachochytrium salamandrivorans]
MTATHFCGARSTVLESLNRCAASCSTEDFSMPAKGRRRPRPRPRHPHGASCSDPPPWASAARLVPGEGAAMPFDELLCGRILGQEGRVAREHDLFKVESDGGGEVCGAAELPGDGGDDHFRPIQHPQAHRVQEVRGLPPLGEKPTIESKEAIQNFIRNREAANRQRELEEQAKE